jgi:SAM-dependent methyltransferase
MAQHEQKDILVLGDILDLSYRISKYSSPMKPFIRFSKQADCVYDRISKSTFPLFWDFDYTLQKILFQLIQEISSPEELEDLCVKRWKVNLEPLYQRRKEELDEFSRLNSKPQFHFTHRDKYIFSKIKPGGRLLYIGCGSGTECLKYADHGYHVLGIDTNEKLIEISNRWANYLNLPFQAICMDVMDLALVADSFDGFLIEFYGFQPSFAQTIILQKELGRVLNKNGRGIIVANRKGYASHWYKMGQYPSPKMTTWLASFSKLDNFYSLLDSCEERLLYGLYNRYHTIESFSNELGISFDVLECQYEESDPRYVISLVKSKDNPQNKLSTLKNEWADHRFILSDPIDRMKIIEKIRSICDILEAHEQKLITFFNTTESMGAKPFTAMETELPRVITLLKEIFKIYSCSDPGFKINI